ncbi:MAG: hypothetical protein SGILL_003083, partial [Bacillariaceae sp.]
MLTSILYSSRRDYYRYENSDDEENDEEEEEDLLEIFPKSNIPKYRNPSLKKEANISRRRRVVAEEEEEVDDDGGDEEDLLEINENFDEDDEDNEQEDPPRNQRKSANRRGRDYYEMDDDDWDDNEDVDYDDDYEDEFDEPGGSGGNFWSNPTDGMDRPPRGIRDRDLTRRRPRVVNVRRGERRSRSRRPQRDYDGRPDYFVNDSRRTPRRGPEWRSPVRMGQQKPPKLIEDLYNRVFFYGFDVDDNLDVGDKTVFGGTKGKFNGLKYLAAAEGRDPARYNKRRRTGPRPRTRGGRGLPPSMDDEEEEDFYEDDEEMDGPERYSLEDSESYPRQSVRKRYSRRLERGGDPSSRRRPRNEEEYEESFGGNGVGDWVSDQVSSWFTDEDDGGYDNFEDGDRYDGSMSRTSRRQRRRGREGSEWTPLNMIDNFFRIDREEMEYKAAEYDAKMGLRRGKSRRSQQSERTRAPRREAPRETPRRAGYAYKYDASLDDDGSPTVVDIDVTIEEDPKPESASNGDTSADSTDDRTSTDDARSNRTEKSWEERQAAVERVPPVDVPAWGPKGELPITGRQKAIEDALKDIQTAKRKLNDRVKKEIKARDELAILNVDAKAMRLKIEQSRRGGPRYGSERLRQTELEIDEASRQLRRARKRVDIARDELAEFEDRHYAVLSYYSPDQANR